MKDVWERALGSREDVFRSGCIAQCDFVRRVNTAGKCAIIGKQCVLPYRAER